MTVQKFLHLKPLLITQFPSLWLKNKCWNSVWKTSWASGIIVSHLAKRNTSVHREFVFTTSQNFGKKYPEYPFIYTVFKQWFGLFVLELPASQENSLVLGDLPTVRKQHERETAVVQCERWEIREQDWEIKGEGSEAREREEWRHRQGTRRERLFLSWGLLPLADLVGCIQAIPPCGGWQKEPRAQE